MTFWDTANAYGFGTSEEICGRAIRKYSRREDIVLATKIFFKMDDSPGGSGRQAAAKARSRRRVGTGEDCEAGGTGAPSTAGLSAFAGASKPRTSFSISVPRV